MLVLVSLWSLVFIIIAIALVLLLKGINRAMGKLNRILDQGEDMASGLGALSKVASAGVAGLLIKAGASGVKKALGKGLKRSHR